MALLTRQNASGLAGAEITFAAAAVGGDTVVGGQGVHLLVRNDDASSTTVTVATPETVDGDLAVADRDVVVAAGAYHVIPVPSRYNSSSTGEASISYTSVTTLFVAAVRGSVTP